MQSDDYFDYAKNHYFAEFERKKDLAAGIATSTGVTSVVGAAVYALAFKLPTISSCLGAISYTGLLFAAISLALAMYRLVRAHIGHEYMHTAAITGIEASRQKAVSSGFTEEQLSGATRLLIQEQYVASVAMNERANDAKSGWLHSANVALVRSVAILFAVGALTVVSHVVREVDGSKRNGAGQQSGPASAGKAGGSSATAGSAADADN